MLRKLIVGIVLCLLPQVAAAQRLEWSPRALNQVYNLAQGLTNEVVMCGRGVKSDSVWTVQEFDLMMLSRSDTAHTQSETCPAGTLVLWHNHPWTGPDDSGLLNKPADLCAMSRSDQWSIQLSGVPFAAISVGRGDPKYTWLCWWRRDQVHDLPVMFPSIPDQRLKYWI